MPKQLTTEPKAKRMESALTFLQRYHDDGDELLDRNITGDETWVAHITAEKCTSQCIGDTVDLSTRLNLSRICPCGKWCARCSGTNGTFSSSTSWPEVRRWMLSVTAKMQELRRAIQNKRCGMLSAGILLHDNARPHRARRSTHLLQEFRWEVFNHPPYIPYLAPSDFHVFLHFNKFLSGQRQCIQNDRKAEMSATQWFQSQAADFYDTGYKNWSHSRTYCMSQFRRLGWK